MSLVRDDAEYSFVCNQFHENVPRYYRLVTPEMIFIPWLRTVYEAMIRLHERGIDPDYVNLRGELSDSGLLKEIGGIEKVVVVFGQHLLRGMLSTSAASVIEAYQRRELHGVLTAALSDVETKPAGEVAASVREATTKIGASHGGAVELWKVMDEMDTTKTRFLETGIAMLDDLTNGEGIPLGEPTLIGGMSGGGKSLLASEICANLALRGLPSLIWSLELDREKMAARMMRQLTGLSQRKFGPEKWDHALDMVCRAGTLIVDDSDNLDNVTVERLLATVEELKETVPLACVVVDYVQLLSTNRRGDEWQQQEHIGKMIRQFSLRSKIPFLCLSQIDFDKRTGEPFTSGSKKWKNHAGMFASLIKHTEKDGTLTRKLWVTKNRHGEDGVHYDIHITGADLRIRRAS